MILVQITRARARARRRQFTEAEVAAWRERIFGEAMEDPVKVAAGDGSPHPRRPMTKPETPHGENETPHGGKP